MNPIDPQDLRPCLVSFLPKRTQFQRLAPDVVRSVSLWLAWRRHVKKGLNYSSQNAAMRVAMATVVALLFLIIVDEQLNDGRYGRAAMTMLSQITKSFG